MSKMSKKNQIKTVLFSICALILGLLLGSTTYVLAFTPVSDTIYSVTKGELSVHFLELGNQYAGDCIYIKANDNDILIDAGSRQQSITTISKYLSNYLPEGDTTLEYVIATHAHQDHISAFPSNGSRKGVFATYDVKNIIDFGTATKYERNNATETKVYSDYKKERDLEIESGANYAPVSNYDKQGNFLQNIDGHISGTTIIDLGEGIKLTILENFYYYEENKTANENDYSVCVLLTQGSTNILLTGDLEEKGEEKLVELNPTLPECNLFKAAHHGSYTGSTDVLLNKIKPKNVVFTCVAGSSEYTTNENNMFPSQRAIDRIAKHTVNCYVTSVCTNTKEEVLNKTYGQFASMNGDIIFISNKNESRIVCTNNDILLKNTDWFKANRTWPNVA